MTFYRQNKITTASQHHPLCYTLDNQVLTVDYGSWTVNCALLDILSNAK